MNIRKIIFFTLIIAQNVIFPYVTYADALREPPGSHREPPPSKE